MTRFIQWALCLVVVALLAGAGLMAYRAHQRTEATLRAFGLTTRDTVIAQLSAELHSRRAAEVALRDSAATARSQKVAAEFAEAATRRRYEAEKRELLASLESAEDAFGQREKPPDVQPVLAAADSAIAAAEHRADAAATVARLETARADSATLRADLAERLAARADSGRIAAVDSARRAISQRERRRLWQTVKIATVGAIAIEVLRLGAGVLLVPR